MQLKAALKRASELEAQCEDAVASLSEYRLAFQQKDAELTAAKQSVRSAVTEAMANTTSGVPLLLMC